MIVVAHLLASLRPSGMERMLETSAAYWSALGTRHVIIGYGGEHPFRTKLEDAGYEVLTLKSAPRTPAAIVRLARLLKVVDPNVIHIHTESSYLATVIAAVLAINGRGIIVRTIHNIFMARGRWYFQRRAQALLADRFVSTFIAPSPEVAEYEYQQVRRNCAVIYNWVDDRFFEIAKLRNQAQVDNEVPLALLVGNCSSVKNHEMALEAVHAAGHRLIHLGNESDASSQELILLDTLQAEGRLVSREVAAPDDALLKASYFLMPSRHEGMGVALAEAVVSCVPALAADAPGLQWARQFPGVTFIDLDQARWNDALAQQTWTASVVPGSEIDLSARAGTFAYSEVYRAALGRRLRHRRRKASAC